MEGFFNSMLVKNGFGMKPLNIGGMDYPVEREMH